MEDDWLCDDDACQGDAEADLQAELAALQEENEQLKRRLQAAEEVVQTARAYFDDPVSTPSPVVLDAIAAYEATLTAGGSDAQN
jgi:hypothetical protein